ncbi:fumarate hydratase [Budvicia aquatica]|uniref:Fumarate hydratase n=1 Tax=Budvicia aquatica TaxID=82979 RepID=A0A2C6DFY5_9GAMM|nr:fumarate hydratase [Budvicia aquatica]MBP9642100.1 fumarate hydratase [Budvicia sp.]PHI28117.1 fumarate hydratase [Budvicia aquatica]GKX50902.1 fumarate hydratase [Budvicia aquatica]
MKDLGITYQDVYDLLHRACTTISPDVLYLMRNAVVQESHPEAKVFLETMIDNVAQATLQDKPVCQSPGFPTVWIRFGEYFDMGPLLSYLPKALTQATQEGLIRPSIVHPLTRHNPGDSTGLGVPNIELRYVPDQPFVEIIMSAKGCGAELGNISKILTPATLGKNYSGLKQLVLDTVINAGGFPCPPSAIGIGLGGQMDISAKLSREAISTRSWLDHNPDALLDELEQELLEDINKLGIGPGGIGGKTTTLAVKIAYAATHTAICPVTINFHCWVARRFGVRIYPDGRRESLFQVEE